MDYRHESITYTNADLDYPKPPQRIKAPMDGSGWGFNIEPSIASMLKENIILVVGFRYQMIILSSDYKGEQTIHYSNMKDQVYGVYVNAMYRFK
jgi:hypothetical protein